jgi:hypothetical protein
VKLRWLAKAGKSRTGGLHDNDGLPIKGRGAGPAEAIEPAQPEPSSCRLTLSLLTFASFESCARLVSSLCPWLKERAESSGLATTIIVRNNNPHLDSSAFDRIWRDLMTEFESINFMLFNEGYNVGVGAGHNLNFAARDSDIFLVLDEGIELANLNWLDQVVAIFNNNPKVAAVGAANSNSTSASPFFANGAQDWQGMRWPLRYAAGSVLAVRSKVFVALGRFDEAYQWAMFEDADLSFRLQAHGYEIAWIDIPHERVRTAEIGAVPTQTTSSNLENNRSVLFAKWNVAFRDNQIGRAEIYDLWSPGIGDVFCAMLHLRVFVDTLTEEQKSAVVLNTSVPELARMLFGDEIVIESISDEQALRARFSPYGTRSLKTLRGLNYGLPFNIHAVVCAALGIPVASPHTISAVLQTLQFGARLDSLTPMPTSPYCVLHLESERAGHDGRAPSPGTAHCIARTATELFGHVVLVGRQRVLPTDLFADGGARITDLQGRLSLVELVEVVAGADAFVGLDSFPGHVAQAAGVRSAVFFGSVHPTFRVLSEGQNWPIVKPLDCSGCYHTSLEPGVPFCMRRDVSCTKDVDPAIIRAAIEGCAKLEGFDWRTLSAQALELQRRFFLKMFFHPAPEARFFDWKRVPNEAASHLIYRFIDQVHEVMLHTTGYSMRTPVWRELDEARAEVFRKDVQIESMTKLIAELRGR